MSNNIVFVVQVAPCRAVYLCFWLALLKVSNHRPHFFCFWIPFVCSLASHCCLCVREPSFTFWRTEYCEEHRWPWIGFVFSRRFHQILFSRPSGCFSQNSFRCCIAGLTAVCTAPANWRRRGKEALDDDIAAGDFPANEYTHSVCLGRCDHHRRNPMRWVVAKLYIGFVHSLEIVSSVPAGWLYMYTNCTTLLYYYLLCSAILYTLVRCFHAAWGKPCSREHYVRCTKLQAHAAGPPELPLCPTQNADFLYREEEPSQLSHL